MPTASVLTFPLVALLVTLSDAANTSFMWVAVACCILVVLIRLDALPLAFSSLSSLGVNLGSLILSNSSFSFARSCRVRPLSTWRTDFLVVLVVTLIVFAVVNADAATSSNATPSRTAGGDNGFALVADFYHL